MSPISLVPLAIMGQLFGGPTRLIITAPDGGVPVVGVQAPLEVAAPDGGFEVFVPKRILAYVSNDPDTWLAVAGDSQGSPLHVEATGLAGAPVITSLSSTTLAALAAPSCTCALPQVVVLTPTPAQLPLDGGHADPTTQWHLTNLAISRDVCCLPSLDGGSADLNCDSLAYIGMANGGTIDIEGAQLTHIIFCKSDGTLPAHTATVNVWECSCK